MSKFIPRAIFPHFESIPRSYFLGHHRAGLEKMKSRISSVDLVIECRDFRAPVCSINPLFNEALGEKRRLIVYTKRDLGGDGKRENKEREKIIRDWDKTSEVLFASTHEKKSMNSIIQYLRENSSALGGVTGTRAMVVGMPNVGKSSLINSLRNVSLKKPKAARTGAQPGVTRKIGTEIKVIEEEEGNGVYVLDTPGVFVPYMPDAESMLKLALCGSVKDTIVPPTTLADYLLYHINLTKPSVYKEYSEPTNEIMPFLEKVATKTGRLGRGGIPDTEASALWIIQRWRSGHLGAFILDDVRTTTMQERKDQLEMLGGSITQARKAEKSARMDAIKQRSIDFTAS
ncbi:Mitochondrial GTPase [Arachnomyces sp. PD_36]|nr:Mitochondrial GTPase [Arachnomyces sp. PD_36]